MAGAWKALVLVVGLAIVSCVARRRLTYDDIVTKALKIYNDGQQGNPLFRLLEAVPPQLVSVCGLCLGSKHHWLYSHMADGQDTVPGIGTKCIVDISYYYYNVSST